MEAKSLTSQDYQEALKDLGIRLISVSEVIKQILGKSLPAVGTTAGRVAAQHLPYYFEDVDLKKALEEMKAALSPAWCFEYKIINASDIEVIFKDCALREICERENKELGGDLCTLFHGYFSGLLAGLLKKRFPGQMEEIGDTCLMKLNMK